MQTVKRTEDTIDLSDAIGLAEAARRMRGRGGRPPNVETVRRWANPKRGCRPAGRQGPQLLLRVLQLNGELLTRPAWVEEFERERLRLGLRQPPAELPRSDPRHAAAQRRAKETLRRHGVGGAGD